jgi:xylan 1,4-beta-xylosidase
VTVRDRGGARILATSILDDTRPVELSAEVDGATARFRVDGVRLGPDLDVGILSDDYGDALRFTGSMAGIFAFDAVDAAFTATFRSIRLRQWGIPAG